MDGVILTPLKQIYTPKGDVFHAMKKSDEGFGGYGEAYFSSINCGEIKGWKKHTMMTMNIIVPVGEIEFVICDNSFNEFLNVKLSLNNYQRLTVKPGYWVAFRGVGDHNLLLNIASAEHDKNEAVNTELHKVPYVW